MFSTEINKKETGNEKKHRYLKKNKNKKGELIKVNKSKRRRIKIYIK